MNAPSRAPKAHTRPTHLAVIADLTAVGTAGHALQATVGQRYRQRVARRAVGGRARGAVGAAGTFCVAWLAHVIVERLVAASTTLCQAHSVGAVGAVGHVRALLAHFRPRAPAADALAARGAGGAE